jgi:hypothetical protein
MNETNTPYHFFISHASEDKKEFVRPLYDKLKKQKFRVWYDEHKLKPGESIRQQIDKGLSESRFGIVVLSEAYFKKIWAKLELDALMAKMQENENCIIPIWYNVTHKDVLKFSPVIAGIKAIKSEEGLTNIVKEIGKKIKSDDEGNDA